MYMMNTMTASSNSASRAAKNFENSKVMCLSKRDKSSAGDLDVRVREICHFLNALPMYYTLSSCSGRCFLYRGPGVKATNCFRRYRVRHDRIEDARHYFDVSTLEEEPMPLDARDQNGDQSDNNHNYDLAAHADATYNLPCSSTATSSPTTNDKCSVWLRFEPFILHVACHSMSAAWKLMQLARPSFKNVGLTAWDHERQHVDRYVVAIWGEEGLDLPLQVPHRSSAAVVDMLGHDYLASLINERHERNWSKMKRFEQALRRLTALDFEESDFHCDAETNFINPSSCLKKTRKSFDVIGDVAVLYSPTNDDPEELKQIGSEILLRNKAIKIVAVRQSNLAGLERAPGTHGLSIISGPNRTPLITTHCEYGVKCLVDLHHTFFSPRMATERLRLCQQVSRPEHVLVLFSGVAMDALQLASRTPSVSVTAIELNPVAFKCACRSQGLLKRNRSVPNSDATSRLQIIEGDVFELLPTLPRNFYHRVVCPRPKEGVMDSDLGDGTGGEKFLHVIIPVMKEESAVYHWYDFVSQSEYPDCRRSHSMLERICGQNDRQVEILRVVNVGSVAARQFRVCIDFRVYQI